MTLAAGLAAVLLAALGQVAAMPEFSIFGVQPNVVIVLLVAWAAVRGQRESLLLIPAAGLLLGLLDAQPLGLAMLALSPLILLGALRELRLVESDLVPAIVMVAVTTLVYEGTLLVTLAVTGEQVDWLASSKDVLVPSAVANVLLLLPVYGLVWLASVDLRRRPAF